MSRRVDRVNELLRLEISQLLARQVKDPRLSGVITITEVRAAPDLRTALVLVSVMGDDETKKTALAGIQSAAKFMRRELRDRVSLRYVPFLSFTLDDSLETSDRLMGMLNQIHLDQSGADAEVAPAADGSHVNPSPATNN
ncbi:MAG TPA: 30S ribosome-binding factor RbfA [Dehalococcoidia bacterium]|nr:30S ribosome-binding factor RbfA [Dehalococcoidia bacterium]